MIYLGDTDGTAPEDVDVENDDTLTGRLQKDLLPLGGGAGEGFYGNHFSSLNTKHKNVLKATDNVEVARMIQRQAEAVTVSAVQQEMELLGLENNDNFIP